MVTARFFDIDTIVEMENQAWVVDKSQPNIPIHKISKSDFNLIKNGVYRKQNNRMDFNGKTFWLPTDLINKLKVKAKSNRSDFSNLAISLQEFLNPDVIQHIGMNINTDLVSDMKNLTDDIYLVCSRQTKDKYESVINRVTEEFTKMGLEIKAFYYISENFYNQNDDEIKFKKMRLLIQHLIGYKTDDKKFSDQEIDRYQKIYWYDNNYETLKIADQINGLFEIILSKTDPGLRDVIREDVKDFKPCLIVNKVNENSYNRIEEKKVIINLSHLVMTFESFRNY
jgi:hypothetical protein